MVGRNVSSCVVTAKISYCFWCAVICQRCDLWPQCVVRVRRQGCWCPDGPRWEVKSGGIVADVLMTLIKSEGMDAGILMDSDILQVRRHECWCPGRPQSVVKCTNYTFCYYYRDLARIETLSIIERDSYIWLLLVTATISYYFWYFWGTDDNTWIKTWPRDHLFQPHLEILQLELKLYFSVGLEYLDGDWGGY